MIEPKYIPGHPTEGTIEKRDAYELWFYETYVKHCHANNCPGCDYCVPYDETMAGRYEGAMARIENNLQEVIAESVQEPVKYDHKIRKYFRGNKIL